MGLLGRRKSGVDFIDFTKTRHGKPLPQPKQESPAPFVGGFLDFTQNSSPQVSPESPSVASDAPSTFGFLSDFSQLGASQPSQSPDVTSRLGNPDAEVNALRLKVDDLEYKIERLLERIATLESQSS